MRTYKCIATLTWQFDSEKPPDIALAYAKERLGLILDSNPHGEDFEDFAIQVDLVRMRDRQKLVHLGTFSPEEIFSHISESDTKRDYIVDGKTYAVRMNSDRYFVFRNNPSCVACGITGTKMILDINPGDQSPHFNLYAEENGRLLLMTKDHIVPKSKGGLDVLENYNTTCAECNNLKADYDLTYEQVNILRQLAKNEQKLPKKELRTLINNVREEMAKCNGGFHERHGDIHSGTVGTEATGSIQGDTEAEEFCTTTEASS